MADAISLSGSEDYSSDDTAHVPLAETPTNQLHDVEIIEIGSSDEDGDGRNEEEGSEDDDEDKEEDDDDEQEEEEEEETTDEDYDQVSASESPEAEATPAAAPLSTDMLNPLRNTANRVADQIDQFAQNLGRFKRQSRGPDDPEAFNAACDLVRKYRTIAEHSVEDLSQDPLKKAKQLIQSARGTSLEDRRNGEQIMRWKLEAETWELLFELLSVDGPERRRKAEWAQRTVLQDIHRYSSDAEVWDKFLEADHFALECVIILKWLEKSARGSGSDQMIDQLVSNLETQAERGQGLWAHGWLYTKETIKQAKRLRSWPQPLETSDGNLSSSLIHSDQKEPLITQLDPDAVTRQNHGLQKQDQFFEQATWLSLWKMLREGQSWSRIQEWARERLENWRAASVCGSFSDEEARDGFARMMRCQSQESWLAACSALANNPRSHPVERAVYGLLCGETEPAYAACQGWSDHVYVYFNYIVISRFRSFCQQVQRKLSYSPAAAAKLVVEAPGYTDVHNYLESIKKNERVRAEAKNPYRTIQAAMLSKSYDMFFYQQANGLSVVANESADETLVPKSAVVGVDDAVLIAGRDENAVRIVAHMLPILQSVGRLRADSGFQQMVAVNVVGYVSILQKLRRQELIPLYASVMPMPLMHVVLGRTLVDVVKPAERKRMVKLMENLRIDTGWVMRRQWRYVVGRAQEKQSSGPVQVRRTVMKPPGEPPRIVRPKRNLVGRRVSPEAERMIRSLDWRRYVGGQFGSICQIGTFLYKRFLTSGKLSEAREVLSRCPLSQLSIDSLGYDVTTHPDLWADDGLDGVDRAATTTTTTTMNGEGKTERAKAERQQYYAESQTMHDLEQLVAAFDALEAWANLVDHCEQLSGEQEFREFRHPLQEALDELTTRMEPLFTSGWLLDGLKKSNDADKTELEFIHTTYIPEIVLGYHAALYTAGRILGREILTECMTLATTVSGVPAVTHAFCASRRMCELVDAFTVSSMALAACKTTGTKKRLPQGATLSIWKVEPERKMDWEMEE